MRIDWTVNTFLDQRVLERLRAEYLEMPGLKLTIEQVQRLCGIEPRMCKPLLDALVKASFLRLNSDGTYVRLTEGSVLLPPPARAGLKSKPFVATSRRASWAPCTSRGISGRHLRANRIAKNAA